MIVAAYGLLLPKAIIDGFKLGCVNLHASKLPRWRGAAPIQRAIQAGDAETALGLMRMEVGLDTGPVIDEACVTITPQHTAGTLQDELAALGWPLLQRNWQRLAAGEVGTAQAEANVQYAAKITKAEAEINFNQPAADLIRHLHAFNPAPGAWSEGPLGRIKLLEAEPSDATLAPGELGENAQIGCLDGAIRVTRWQLPGKPAQRAEDLLNAGKLPAGLKLI